MIQKLVMEDKTPASNTRRLQKGAGIRSRFINLPYEMCEKLEWELRDNILIEIDLENKTLVLRSGNVE